MDFNSDTLKLSGLAEGVYIFKVVVTASNPPGSAFSLLIIWFYETTNVHGYGQCCGCWKFIPDHGSWKRIFSITDPGTASKNLSILTQKIVCKLSEIWSGLFFADPDPDFYPSRIQGSKRHRIPDPDPQHWLRWQLSYLHVADII